jgi:hypothetical protein
VSGLTSALVISEEVEYDEGDEQTSKRLPSFSLDWNRKSDWMSRRGESWTYVLTLLISIPHQEMVQPIIGHVLAIPVIGVSGRA